MYVRKKNEEAVSPVIAVILMVAITVVLAGVLYVWVTSLADTSSTTTTTLGVSAQDASTTATGGSFAAGETIVRIDHLTGNAINWSQMTKMTCQIVGQDVQYNLFLKSVKGIAYLNNSANAVSTSGDVILLALSSAGPIPAGSYITVNLVGKSSQWASPKDGFVVN